MGRGPCLPCFPCRNRRTSAADDRAARGAATLSADTAGGEDQSRPASPERGGSLACKTHRWGRGPVRFGCNDPESSAARGRDRLTAGGVAGRGWAPTSKFQGILPPQLRGTGGPELDQAEAQDLLHHQQQDQPESAGGCGHGPGIRDRRPAEVAGLACVQGNAPGRGGIPAITPDSPATALRSGGSGRADASRGRCTLGRSRRRVVRE